MADYEKVYQIRFDTKAAQAQIAGLTAGLEKIGKAANIGLSKIGKEAQTAAKSASMSMQRAEREIEAASRRASAAMVKAVREETRERKASARVAVTAAKEAERATAKAAKAAEVALKKAQLAAKRFREGMVNVGRSMTMYVTAPLVAAGYAALKFASDDEAAFARLDNVLGESGNKVKEFAKTSLDNYGMSTDTAVTTAAAFGDVATSIGFTQDKAADLSIGLTKLAGDLRSAKNVELEEAQSALTGILTGQTRALKTLGVVLNEKTLKEYAHEKGIKKSIGSMSQQEQVILRYQFVLDHTTNALDHFKNNQDLSHDASFKLKETLEELSSDIGRKLLPVKLRLLRIVEKLFKWWENLSESNKNLVVEMSGLVATLGPLILIGGKVLVLFRAIKSALAALIPFIVSNPITLIFGVIAAAILVTYKNWNLFVSSLEQSITQVVIWFTQLKKIIVETWGSLVSGAETAINQVVIWFYELRKKIVEIFSDAVNWVTDKFNSILVMLGKEPIKIGAVFDTSDIDKKIAELETRKASIKNGADTSSIDAEIGQLKDRYNRIDIGKAIEQDKKDSLFRIFDLPEEGSENNKTTKPSAATIAQKQVHRSTARKAVVDRDKNVVDRYLRNLSGKSQKTNNIHMGDTNVTVNAAGGDPQTTARMVRKELEKHDMKKARQLRRATSETAAFEQ